ncbi:MAG: HDOD domain-containing protein [Halioglobus sp.]
MDTSAAENSVQPMSVEGLRDLVLGSEDLPTLPTVATQVVTLTAKEETTLADVAELVMQDVALSSKILKVANSAFYSFPQQIGSIQQAVSMLGTNAVQSLVLSFSLLQINKGKSQRKFDFDKFWERSIAQAISAQLILSKVPGADTEEIFVSALLQNLGQLVLACTQPDLYDQVLERMEGDTSVDELQAEVGVFGGDHCFLGYEVAKHWNFPLSISLPILHHHDPVSYVGGDKDINNATRAIYLSDLLINIFHSDNPEEYHKRFHAEVKQLLGLSASVVDEILEIAHTELEEGAVNFGVKISEARPVQEILQEANIRLSLLNLDYDQVNKELVKAKVSLEKLAKELQEKNTLLKELADQDGLTGLYNNRFFQGALDRELNRTVRQKYQLSLVLIDIDHFKRFNDDHGHLVGDFVLAEFAKVLSENLREYDTLARYGGEEFVVILPETPAADAAMVAEKLRKAVESRAFKEDGNLYKVTASFGVSTRDGNQEEGPNKMQLIKTADEALYDAKKKGRNQVSVYAGAKKGWFKR